LTNTKALIKMYLEVKNGKRHDAPVGKGEEEGLREGDHEFQEKMDTVYFGVRPS